MAQLVKQVNELDIASVKRVNELAIASVKTIQGLDNTAGGGGGAFVYVTRASGTAGDSTPVTTRTVQLTGVTAGHLVVVYMKHEGTARTLSCSDGTTSLTAKTRVDHSNDDLHGQFFYILSSVASGTVTYTVTASGTIVYACAHAWEYSYTGTAVFDVEPSGGGASGTSTAPNSGNMALTGTYSVALGGYGNYGGGNLGTPLINAVGADHTQTEALSDTSFDRIVSSGFTGAASGTITSSPWTLNALAFKTQ